MTAPLSLPQMLGLWKWLTTVLDKEVREKQLLPQAEREMPSDSRLPIMFGGQHAGWANMPKPSQPSAYVKDKAALLAWAKAEYAEKVENVPEVIVDAGLLEFLQEHRPGSLRMTERVDPQWTADICQGLASKDACYITSKGERLTDVPGITVPEPTKPVPHVKLSDDAGRIIREAWPQLQGALGPMLALPNGEQPAEVPHAA